MVKTDIDTAISKSLDFILTHKNENGAWEDFITHIGKSTSWVTGYILYTIKEFITSKKNFEDTKSYLLNVFENNGWGYNPTVPPDADSTSFVVLGLDGIVNWKNNMREKIILFLKNHKVNGGYSTYNNHSGVFKTMNLPLGFPIHGWTQAHNEVTASVMMALQKLDAKPNGCPKELLSPQDNRGMWNSYWWTSDLVATEISLEYLKKQNFPIKNSKKIQQSIRSMQAKDGSIFLNQVPSPFNTSLGLKILILQNSDKKSLIKISDWLISNQNNEGSWPSEYILRIPRTDCVNPKSGTPWTFDGLGVNCIIKDQEKLFTTTTILSSLLQMKNYLDNG